MKGTNVKLQGDRRELPTATEEQAWEAVRTILRYIGEDPEREGLIGTPQRVVRAWDEMTEGYGQDPADILASADFHGEGYDQMISVPHIEFFSMCEHHALPFWGEAFVSYIPGKAGRVVGLSKVARLVECYARRLQIQERMTQQIAAAMKQHLKPLGVGVVVRAKHMCMMCRGVRSQRAEMVTTSLAGVFREAEVRAEFLSCVNHC